MILLNPIEFNVLNLQVPRATFVRPIYLIQELQLCNFIDFILSTKISVLILIHKEDKILITNRGIFRFGLKTVVYKSVKGDFRLILRTFLYPNS